MRTQYLWYKRLNRRAISSVKDLDLSGKTILSSGAITLCSALIFMLPSFVAGQTSASVSLSKDVVKAGDQLTLTVALDKAPSYDGDFNVYFDPQDGVKNVEIGFGSQILKGQQTISMTQTVPVDTNAGIYTITSLRFTRSNSTYLKISSPISFQVISAEGLVSPTEATITLALNQKQFLETQASRLQTLKDGLLERLSVDPADSPQLKGLLSDTVTDADALLAQAEIRYKKFKGSAMNQEPPLFFEDFHRHYQDLLQDTTPFKMPTAFVDGQPRLVRAQLKSRDASKSSNPNAKGYPLLAQVVLEWLGRNIAAYRRIDQMGTDTFSFSIASVPTQASISYTRIGEPFKDLSSPTDVDNQKLPLAMWTFKIVRDGCDPKIWNPDPYFEERPSFKGLLKCRKR